MSFISNASLLLADNEELVSDNAIEEAAYLLSKIPKTNSVDICISHVDYWKRTYKCNDLSKKILTNARRLWLLSLAFLIHNNDKDSDTATYLSMPNKLDKNYERNINTLKQNIKDIKDKMYILDDKITNSVLEHYTFVWELEYSKMTLAVDAYDVALEIWASVLTDIIFNSKGKHTEKIDKVFVRDD